MPRFSAPIAVLTLLGGALAGCSAGVLGAPIPSVPTSTAVPVSDAAPGHPTISFTINGGPGDGRYESDPTSTLGYCMHTADGSWRVIYGGGVPYVTIDLVFGARIATPEGASDVAAEISAGDAYLWMDQPDFRGGDAKGRSSATVVVTSDPTATTFHMTGTTPNRTPDGDGASSAVDLTAVCPA